MAPRVLLDSTALRWETATSAPLADVLAACEAGLIELHVPEFVIKEVASGLAGDARLSGRTRKELARAAGWSRGGEQVEEAVKRLHGFAGEAARSIEAGLRGQLDRAGATIAPLGAPDLGAVLADYFAGAGMFSDAAKVRDHLPDALVHDLVRQLTASGVPDVVVVTRDRRLGAACEALPGVVGVYFDLRGFTESRWMPSGEAP